MLFVFGTTMIMIMLVTNDCVAVFRLVLTYRIRYYVRLSVADNVGFTPMVARRIAAVASESL